MFLRQGRVAVLVLLATLACLRGEVLAASAANSTNPLLGTWQGLLDNDPTALIVHPDRVHLIAHYDPTVSATPQFQFEASYVLDRVARTIVLHIGTLQGIRTLHGRWEIMESGKPIMLKLSLGSQMPSSASAPQSSQPSAGTDANPGPVYFVGASSSEGVDYSNLDYAPGGSCHYIVKPGESADAIAKKYNLQWQDLFALNGNLMHPSFLREGDVLSIGKTYNVKEGDSLWQIATQFGTSWQRMIDYNPALSVCSNQVLSSSPVCRIHPGDKLCIVPFLRNAICVEPNPARVFRVPATG